MIHVVFQVPSDQSSVQAVSKATQLVAPDPVSGTGHGFRRLAVHGIGGFIGIDPTAGPYAGFKMDLALP